MQIPNVFGAVASPVDVSVTGWEIAQQTGSLANLSPFDIIVFKYQKCLYMRLGG